MAVTGVCDKQGIALFLVQTACFSTRGVWPEDLAKEDPDLDPPDNK
jgi:hypothetical protein